MVWKYSWANPRKTTGAKTTNENIGQRSTAGRKLKASATGMSSTPALMVPGAPSAAARPDSPHTIAIVYRANFDQRSSLPALPDLVSIPCASPVSYPSLSQQRVELLSYLGRALDLAS